MRIQPLKMKDLKKVQAHNKREFIEKHVDEYRSHLNRSFAGTGDFEFDIQSVIDRYGMNDKRSTNIACEMILTANHEWFELGTEQEQKERLREWTKTNVEWLRERYGDALISCDLHLDETAPHFHAVIAAKATYTKRYRHGEKEVTRIAYNKIFGDTAAVIAKARKEVNSELTKTGRLQSEYGEAMNSLGLERGTYNSFAVNQKTSEWREIADADPSAERPKAPRRLKKPNVGILGKKIIEKWAEREVGNAHKYVMRMKAYMGKLETEIKHAKVFEERSNSATSVVNKLRKQVKALEGEVRLLKDQLSKDQISTLRKVPVELVARSCNYTGTINPKKHKNAIDFLIDTEKMKYNDAIVYLDDLFSHEEAKDTIRQFYSDAADSAAKSDLKEAIREQAKNGLRLSRQECATKKEMENQLNALNADEYRITLINEDSSDSSDKHKDEVEYKYSANELIDPKIVRMLNVKNHKEGYSVFVTPYSQRHSYIFVNEVTTEAKGRMERAGYTFATTAETSPDSIQGVLKVYTEGCSEQILKYFSSQLNKKYGASDISDHLHLAGFKNMNPEYPSVSGHRPLITLKEFTGHLCKYAKQKIKEIFYFTLGKGVK